jgi:GT2 family glycosyltransferase
MDALVVVVAYHNPILTERAIHSLQSQTHPTRIVVWDNGGNGQLLNQHKDVTVHISDKNVMWTPAVNAAVEQYWQGEDYIGYMNNDAAPLPHTVERLVALLQEPKVGLVAPSMDYIGGPQDIANCVGHNLVQKGGPRLEENLKDLPAKRVNFVMGAFAMLRKTVWDEVGELDEDMPLGADDHDYAIRLKQAGYQIWVAQNAFCKHAGHASARVGRDAEKLWVDWGAKSWDVFNNKWAGYYRTEEEAIKCHWAGEYEEGWDCGTGWAANSC